MLGSLKRFLGIGAQPSPSTRPIRVRTAYISQLTPGKYRLPMTAETIAAQVVYSESDVPYPV